MPIPDQKLVTGLNASKHEVVIGQEIQTKGPVALGQAERRSGLYILGKPRMGKSTVLANIAMQDMIKGHSAFFLDPHGQAIQDLIERCPAIHLAVTKSAVGKVYLLNPADDDYSFGINPLYCKNVNSRSERNEAVNKTFSVFKRIWERDNQWGVWLELILRNSLPVLVETEQTLAEVPLFLNNQKFRNYLLSKVRYNTSTLEFWKYEFKQEQAQPAIVRVRALLGDDDYVRDIIGQQKTTIDFGALTKNVAQFLLYRLPPNLNEESGRFIGTIILTELLHAIRSRTEEDAKTNYCLFIDEFQHFTTQGLNKFILEAGKWGCAVALAHQERRGQFQENEEILGATQACANKILFQATVNDARELAPEFAPLASDVETPSRAIFSPHAVEEIWDRGHEHKEVMDTRKKYFYFVDFMRSQKDTHFALPGNIATWYPSVVSMYASSKEMITNAIVAINSFYYEAMQKSPNRLFTRKEVSLITSVVTDVGGVLGFYPAMAPYIPEEMRRGRGYQNG